MWEIFPNAVDEEFHDLYVPIVGSQMQSCGSCSLISVGQQFLTLVVTLVDDFQRLDFAIVGVVHEHGDFSIDSARGWRRRWGRTRLSSPLWLGAHL